MLIVVALGGNALLQRGEPLEAELQHKNVKATAKALAALAKEHQLVICHGNGPQVGLLALQSEAYRDVKPYPLDVLDAESQGMIGYLIQQEVGNLLPGRHVVTLLTQVVVDQNDNAFKKPAKPIGPVYDQATAENLRTSRGYQIAPDGKYFRRVVPSPEPKDIVELDIARELLKLNTVVIFGGGGGIPVLKNSDGTYTGVEAVIDKDNTASLIAEKLNADQLLILTDVAAVCENFGKENERRIKAASCEVFQKMDFARGSMGPKIYASCRFVAHSHKKAAIGRLYDVADILAGKAGTVVTMGEGGVVYY